MENFVYIRSLCEQTKIIKKILQTLWPLFIDRIDMSQDHVPLQGCRLLPLLTELNAKTIMPKLLHF